MTSPPANGTRALPAPLRAVFVLVALYVFAVAVTLMGSAFKMLGHGVAEDVLAWAHNPIMGLFVGLFMTAVVQSSSTVTTMIVTAVAGGLVPMPVAVPMVMGANIGTTVTNSLVAMGAVLRREEFERSIAAATVHDFFNVLAVAMLLPAEIVVQATGLLRTVPAGQPVGVLGWLGDTVSRLVPESAASLGVEKGSGGFEFIFKEPSTGVLDRLSAWFSEGACETAKALAKAAGADDAPAHLARAASWTGGLGVVIGLAALSVCLVVISKNMRVLVVDRFEGAFGGRVLQNPAACIAIGIVFTVLVQSSSITTSILVPVAAAGLLRLRQVFHVTLGANIGTTCTGLLAALFLLAGGEQGARLGLSIALVHVMFNVLGMTLVLGLPILRDVPVRLAKRFAAVCVERKLVAVGYIVGLFFAGPGVLLLLYRAAQALF